MGRTQKKIVKPDLTKIKCVNISEDKASIIYNGQTTPYGKYLLLDMNELQSKTIRQFFRSDRLRIVNTVEKPEILSKRKKGSLRILLHAPLHPSFWIYLMETMPEHEWFIEPEENFQEGMVPREQVKYTIAPPDSNIQVDLQIIVLHIPAPPNQYINQFPIPTVFLEFWQNEYVQSLASSFEIKYPLISAVKNFSSSHYPNFRYSYIPPSKTLWNKNWKGDKPSIFIPAQLYLEPKHTKTDFAKIICMLQKTDLNLDIVRAQKIPEDEDAALYANCRNEPFDKWQNRFIHNRVLLDCSQKPNSFVMEEAMTIGMPIVARGQTELPFIIRDRVDGFTEWKTDKELIRILRKFTTDISFARRWGLKAKKRAREIFTYDKTRTTFNDAFRDAIRLFYSTPTPFKKVKR